MTGRDRLMESLVALFEAPGNACFDTIRYCPAEHVLSFRYAGDDDWVNVWLHGGTDGDAFAHVVERNGQPGGSGDVLLWREGQREGGQFVFDMPMRADMRTFDGDDLYRGRGRRTTFKLVAGDDEPGWDTDNPPGVCYFCPRATTHVVEWPPQAVQGVDRHRTFACADDAEKIRTYQLILGLEVTVREAP